jgi:hypothetical protein
MPKDGDTPAHIRISPVPTGPALLLLLFCSFVIGFALLIVCSLLLGYVVQGESGFLRLFVCLFVVVFRSMRGNGFGLQAINKTGQQYR